jgi:hypothetical protein
MRVRLDVSSKIRLKRQRNSEKSFQKASSYASQNRQKTKKLLVRPLLCKLRDAIAWEKIYIRKQDVACASMVQSNIPHGIDRVWPLRCSHEVKINTMHERRNNLKIFFHVCSVPFRNEMRRQKIRAILGKNYCYNAIDMGPFQTSSSCLSAPTLSEVI